MKKRRLEKAYYRNSAFCILHSAFSSGFSLVEVSLAMLVVSLGILSVIGMFPAGLDQNTRSINDTHFALFAEDLFGSLGAQAETNWLGIGTTISNLPVAATNDWDNPAGLTIRLDNQVHTNIYSYPGNSNIVDHAFRYRITLATNGLVKTAGLRLWPGEFGSANNPAVFYEEFFQLNP